MLWKMLRPKTLESSFNAIRIIVFRKETELYVVLYWQDRIDQWPRNKFLLFND